MDQWKKKLLEKAKEAKRESKSIEFKRSFDITNTGEWCEVIKDIIAIANSGGGVVIFGLESDATLTDFDSSSILKLDPVAVTEKIFPYTNTVVDFIEIEQIEKNGRLLAAFIIERSVIPLVFCNPGAYSIEGGKQKTAFGRGTVYFRHGAKSETGNTNDIKNSLERNIEETKKSWLGNIRKMASAPSDSRVEIVSREVVPSIDKKAIPIRVTDDISAPVYRIVDPNTTHPYRGIDVLDILYYDCKVRLNQFYLLCIRREYHVDENPDFAYKNLYGRVQYSSLFVDWMKKKFSEDKLFFEKTRLKRIKIKPSK